MKNISKKKIVKIAVVGMSGVFPKAADTCRFLNNILNKKDAVVTVPDHRWAGPVDTFISSHVVEDKAISKKAGLIENFYFDPTGFLVEADLLARLDPVHQLVLHAGRDAFLQCSHTRETRKRTGVILAAIALPTQAASHFSSQILLNPAPYKTEPADFSIASVVSFPAAVLARAMGFEAGCFTLDAACASSLYAIKLACEHLHLKKADIMVAGGVSRPSSLYTQVGFSQLQALSPTGRCSPFDHKANGLVVGEGTGIIILKRLEDAITQGDKVHAVITGAGVSNDIDGTLVGPASEGQQRAMIQAYEQASWSPADIQYMECHGSGTPVGDQVELSSIKALLDQFGCPDKDLRIGSVKSMIGHLLTAAGAAGFIKTVLSMNDHTLPPSLNYSLPSEKSILNHTRIKVQAECENWTPENSRTTRKAAVSAFGFGGINAHLLIEEYQNNATQYFVKTQNTDIEPDTHDPDMVKSDMLKTVPCAIVGMQTIVKDCDTLDQFTSLIFGNTRLLSNDSTNRWKRPDAPYKAIEGFFMDELCTRIGQFHIQPNQMADILPQHLFLLKATLGALTDAGISSRPSDDDPIRQDMGCAIGIDFDYGAADFNLRWQINSLDESYKDAVSKPLTFNRTLGALGGIVASRVAREFKLGGPCFTLSAGMASGMKTIETALHSLSSHETNVFICGCVDLAGEMRQLFLNTAAKPGNNHVLPSEGAAAIVLKRLDQAIEDQDKIYGVITGIGASSGDCIPGETRMDHDQLDQDQSIRQYTRSLTTALESAGTSFKQIGLYETCSSGALTDDTIESSVLENFCNACSPGKNPFMTATTSAIGNTFGASSLFSVIKTALCLYHGLLPDDVSKSTHPNHKDAPQTWEPAPGTTHRQACSATITRDGACSHIILKEHLSNIPKPELTLLSANPMPPGEDKNASPFIHIKTNGHPISEDTLLMIQGSDLKANTIIQEAILEDDGTQILKHENVCGQNPIDFNLLVSGTQATALAHQKFLEFSQDSMVNMEQQFQTLTQLASDIMANPAAIPATDTIAKIAEPAEPEKIFLNRDQCLEYATGKAGNVLGKAFDIIDTYPVRVRLPAEPLMLVDRIMDIQGEMLSLGPGKIITQHDVKENAWYLDGGKTPVSISIEAGQADLFLCAWLGIDHAIKGTRKYRLLDARVTFHRTLPEPGQTIEYHIEIDRFLKQGEVYLFFFHYKGYINDQLLISMRDGCAGFFTEQEVENSGGIILKASDTAKVMPASSFQALAPVKHEQYSDQQIDALRTGDLHTAFGPAFKSITLGKNLLLPGGRMHLIDRVLEFNPTGGRYGLGSIIAQADIHPDDWFLTCHFIDDMVMPGTLMYDCCAHALRVFTQRMGWVSQRNDVCYDIVVNNESDLKCRGPVTRETKKARYEIDIKQMGYAPEPYVIADAHMFSDDLRIVLYKDMGLKIKGLTQGELETFWRER
ncbi:MAG: beta-ketoacyl synthase N-terminal-like domain-containing protein [Pseudomonadota bacterium]